MPLWSKSGKKSEPSNEASDSDRNPITKTRPEEESVASRSADTPIELSAEEKARLLIYNPPPDTTIVRDFVRWQAPKYRDPDGYSIRIPSTVDEAYSDVIKELERPLWEEPVEFRRRREYCMHALFPDVEEWEAQGRPLLPWNETNRDKAVARLKQARTEEAFSFSWTYKSDMSEEEKQLRELVLSVLTCMSLFWNGWGRQYERSAQAVKYDLTGRSDWTPGRGRCSCLSDLKPEFDWITHKHLVLSAARPEQGEAESTRMLKWSCYTYYFDSAPTVPEFKWGWHELEPQEKSIGDEAFKLWQGPLHMRRSPNHDALNTSEKTRTRRASLP